MVIMRFVCLIVIATLLPAVPAMAQENLALGKPYTWSANPNYSACTDPDDATQLTDGVYSTGHYYSYPVNTGTVGWQGYRKPVSVTIDLGAVQPIGGIKLRSTGGYWAIGFPALVNIWTSDDGVTYHYGGELIGQSWRNGLPDGGKLRGLPLGVFEYNADDLELRGQYVKFTAYEAGHYFFTDEIQVLKGDFDPYGVTPSSTTLTGGFEQWARDNKYDPIARVRMHYDLQELTKHPRAGDFQARIDSLRGQVDDMPKVTGIDFKQGLPYNTLGRDIWKLNADMNRAAGMAEFSMAPAKLYDPLHPFDTVTASADTTVVHMIHNEKRSAAFNISNNSAETKAAVVAFNWDGATFPEESVDLKTVRFTEAQQRCIVGSALVGATKLGPNLWQVELPAGATSQLWFDFDTAYFPRGVHGARIQVTPAGASTQTADLTVNVHRGRMGPIPTLGSHVWDYVHPGDSYPATTGANQAVALSLLKNNQIKTHWMSCSGFLPTAGSWNDDGTYKTPPNFDKLNAWLDAVEAQDEPTERYGLYINAFYNGGPRDWTMSVYAGPFATAYGTEKYKTAITGFMQALAAEIDARGMDRSQFVLHVIDEATTTEWVQKAAEFAKIAKEAVPEFLFFTDPAWSSPSQVNELLLEYSDIIQTDYLKLRKPDMFSYYQQYIADHPDKELGTYVTINGGRTRSPNSYMRWMAWAALDMNLRSIGVWSTFATKRGNNMWDDFGACANYEMGLLTPDSADPDKHLTAWRDGVQDYEYFHWLGQALQRSRTAGAPDSLVAWTQAFAETVVDDALSEEVGIPNYEWKYSNANDVFDRAVARILPILDRVGAVAPKRRQLLRDTFDDPDVGFDQTKWNRRQPNVGAPTGVTHVHTYTAVSGKLITIAGEEAVTAGRFDAARFELTLTALMEAHAVGDGFVARIYSDDSLTDGNRRADYIEFTYNDLSTGDDPVTVKRYANGSLAETLVDSTLGDVEATVMLALNIDETNVEVSVVLSELPDDGSCPAILLYLGKHNFTGDLDDIRFALSNQLLTEPSWARWDHVTLTQAVPEPAAPILLMVLGAIGLLVQRRPAHA